ncbi:MAG: DMT family transporter [Myxococcota bacterium]
MFQSVWRWIHSKGYFQGVFWIVLVALCSNSNDIVTRLAGKRLDPIQVAFFRVFFSTLLLLPVMLARNRRLFVTRYPLLHTARAVMGFIAVSCWCYGVGKVPLAVVSVIALTVPLFVLPMATLFLHEKVGWQRTAATLCGFAGIVIIALPNLNQSVVSEVHYMSMLGIGALTLAAVCFAASDILNKKVAGKESHLTVLFYFAAGTALLGFVPALFVWRTPTHLEAMGLFLLGLGGNAILYFLLKAFSATQVSALAPYRYLELIFAGAFGFFLFGETPSATDWIGILIIVLATFAIARHEIKHSLPT